MRQQQSTDLMATGGGRDLSLMAGPDVLDVAGSAGDGSTGGPQANPLHKLNLLLKGRYHWAIGLAVTGALAGAAAGYFSGHPIYESRGYVQIQPTLPKVLSGDDGGVMPFFDSFADAQVSTMQTQRVLDSALQSDTWRATGRPSGPDAAIDLAKALTIVRGRGQQVIQVSVTDREPAVAQAGVKAILEAYRKISSEQDNMSGEKVMDALQNALTVSQSEQAAVRAQIMSIANEYGTDDLQKRYDAELDEVNKAKAALDELQLRLATITTTTTQQGPATREAKELAVEEIAARDRRMDQLLASKHEAERRIAGLDAQGFGPNHRAMVAARSDVADLDRQIEGRAAEYRKLAAGGEMALSATGTSTLADAADPKVLQARIDRVKKLYDEKHAEMLKIGQTRLQIDNLRQQEAAARERQDLYKKRLDQLNLQEKVAGRIQVTGTGDRPQVQKDTRMKLAPGIGFAGGALGFGLVLLRGLLDRRFRSPEELRSSMGGSPMLGVLPELPDDLSDPEQAALTAHFVHQIRTLLQIWDSGVGSQVFSVTSPVSGTGKTSLTLALGVSFAAADSKTLLIDCDLVGGGLTTRANAIVKRKIGRILQREGLLTDKQLEEALRLASGSRRRLGEILVELGHLKEADLDSALVTQQKGSVGLVDVINGESLEDCVAETGIPGLSILPLGGATAQHASKVSPQALRRVLAEARKRYDTILVDTGPVPGSLEAAVVAAEVDGVILCVSRGEQRPLAEKCVQHLLTLGARVAGVVFNRAKTQDMSVYGTAVRTSMPTTSVPSQATAESVRFGPMARAMTYGGKATDETPNGGVGNGQD